jgi:hypothetical protein
MGGSKERDTCALVTLVDPRYKDTFQDVKNMGASKKNLGQPDSRSR